MSCNYSSSTFRIPHCGSSQCTIAKAYCNSLCASSSPPAFCGTNNTCDLIPLNTFTQTNDAGYVAEDTVAVQSADGHVITDPNFIFSCASKNVLSGLATGTQGIAGLGRNRIALPIQLASAFHLTQKFAVCLPMATTISISESPAGVLLIGDGPYTFLPNVNVSSSLIYTRIMTNPVSTSGTSYKKESSVEYFIPVNAIKINGKDLSFNSSSFSIHKNGSGGVKISTVAPYTTMSRPIYKAFTKAFVKAAEAMNISRVAAVEPFKVCFSTKNVLSTRVGPGVPTVDLVLENENSTGVVDWMIFGANSMVQVKDDVLCLGFMKANSTSTVTTKRKAAIVIGGYQMENNLLEFDLAKSRLGFSSSLLFSQTTCANYNFTTTA
ncbi:probable aspartic proteinase GIP2 [Macadamia integrifolia]|uniref:probable aspartic proteinase GIP2 n=1 Tax=Macadamia integrifolia TaxID=60698 RepID=UPI001C4EA857|nr:probable aspartic proteinase GIP2 [Macadamia integrifolia]